MVPLARNAPPDRRGTPGLLARPLLILVSLLLIPLAGWHEWTGREQRLQEVQVASSNLARSLVQDVEGDFAMADTALIGIVQQLEANGSGPDSLAQVERLLTRQLANQPDLRNFSIYGTDGELLLSTFVRGENGIRIADRDYFRQHRSDREAGAIVGSAVRSRLNGHWVVTLSRRFGDAAGNFAGVAVAAIEVASLSRGFAAFQMGRTGSIALVRADGRLLARSPMDESTLDYPVLRRTPIAEAVARHESGTFRFTSPIDGVDRLGAYASSPRYPLTILAGRGAEEALAVATWRSIARMTVVCLLAALLIFLGDRLVRQIRQRRAAERVVAESEAQFRLLAEHASDMVARIDPEGRVRYASPAASRLLGLPARALIGRPMEEIAVPEEREALREALREADTARGPVDVTSRVQRTDGHGVWIETTLQRVRTGDTAEGYVAVSRDVTERRQMEERMAELAATDGLTGLANRRRFDEVLGIEWRRAAREGQPLAVILLDVDRFKLFNDRYGHLAGDDALRAVARALEDTIRRPGDLAARYGGEEFAVILPNTDGNGAREVAERLREAISEAGIRHEANESGLVTASLGAAALVPAPGATPEPSMLVGAADAALYEAKRTGRDRVVQAPSITVMQGRRQAAGGAAR